MNQCCNNCSYDKGKTYCKTCGFFYCSFLCKLSNRKEHKNICASKKYDRYRKLVEYLSYDKKSSKIWKEISLCENNKINDCINNLNDVNIKILNSNGLNFNGAICSSCSSFNSKGDIMRKRFLDYKVCISALHICTDISVKKNIDCLRKNQFSTNCDTYQIIPVSYYLHDRCNKNNMGLITLPSFMSNRELILYLFLCLKRNKIHTCKDIRKLIAKFIVNFSN